MNTWGLGLELRQLGPSRRPCCRGRRNRFPHRFPCPAVVCAVFFAVSVLGGILLAAREAAGAVRLPARATTIHKPLFCTNFILLSSPSLLSIRDADAEIPPSPPRCGEAVSQTASAPDAHPNMSVKPPLFLHGSWRMGSLPRTGFSRKGSLHKDFWRRRGSSPHRVFRRTGILAAHGFLAQGFFPAHGFFAHGFLAAQGLPPPAAGCTVLHERLALRLQSSMRLLSRARERNHVGFEVLVSLGIGVHWRIADERRGAKVVELPDVHHLARRTQAREVIRRSHEGGDGNRVPEAHDVHCGAADGAAPGVAAHAAYVSEDFLAPGDGVLHAGVALLGEEKGGGVMVAFFSAAWAADGIIRPKARRE